MGVMKPKARYTVPDMRFMNPALLAKIGSLESIAKFIVEGFCIKFTEYRKYIPGDDIKHIDWTVYVRTDRY